MSRDETPIYHRSRAATEPVDEPQPVEEPPTVAEAVPVAAESQAVGLQKSDSASDETENAPVVVDLPDGQKVILGSISPGTVIEIAAWRGTERPDSRTTRIVLGVANNPELEEGIPVNNSVKPERRRSRAWIWILVSIAVVAVAVLALLLSPLKFVHPTTGASLGFGSADSSVVVVVPNSDVSTGQLVVANKGDDVIVGQVSGVDSGEVLLQTGSNFTQVPAKSVVGTVTVIIPFIGLAF